MDSVSVVWEYDTAFLKGRENMSGHPLDRNGLQIQEAEGADKRKGGIWWIDREAQSARLEGLQPMKVWENVYGAVHPPKLLDFKGTEGVEKMYQSRLGKAEHSGRICKGHSGEIGRGIFADCSHELLNEVAKTAGQCEGLKVRQRLQDLQVLVFSMRWGRNEVKRGPSRCSLDCSHEACTKSLSIKTATIPFIIHINCHTQARLPPLYKCLDCFLLSCPSDPQLRVDARR